MKEENKNLSGIFKGFNHKRDLNLSGISYSELKALAIKITKNHFDQMDLIQEMYISLLQSPKGNEQVLV
jgi:hypothetical protein